MALTDFLTQIADSIRSMDGTTDAISAADFPQRILDIPGGGGSDLPFDITAGSFTLSEDFYIYTADDGSTDNQYSIEHNLPKTPDMFFMWNTKMDSTVALGSIVYAYCLPNVRIVSEYSRRNLMYRASSSNGAIAGIGSVSLDDTCAILKHTTANQAYLRNGHTYRWFAIAMKEG